MRWPGGGKAVARTSPRPRRSGAALAISASRSRWRSAIAARRSISAARSACSPACTRPRWRSGKASAASRGTAPNTGMPSAAMASATSARCFSLAARLRMTPAMCTAGSCEANPLTTAAADCACRAISSTSTTGSAKCAARSAVAPRRPGVPLAPSNRPITPSMMKISESSAARAANASSSAGGMAQLSRLTLGAPTAAAWNAGSM